jgi:hypothetical protein
MERAISYERWKEGAMRWPRVRFTVRRTIILIWVTASAVGLAAISYQQTASRYRKSARFHSRQSLLHDIASRGQEGLLVGCPSDDGAGGY